MVQIAAPAVPAPRPSRADLTRRRILEAASRVFRRQGLQATGMRDIAAELGMHAGNLYYYFRDKGELLAFCQEATLERLLALAARVEGAQAAADEKLRLLVAGHVVELNEEVPGSLAHLEVEAIDAERRPAILAKRNAYEDTWRRLIEEGIAAGRFRAVDAGTAARALLGAVNWTVKWFRADGEKTAREIGDDFADVLVRGLCAHQRGTRSERPSSGRATGERSAPPRPRPAAVPSPARSPKGVEAKVSWRPAKDDGAARQRSARRGLPPDRRSKR